MEKRPLNRTFFESSLEMKCLFFFGVGLTLVTLVSIYMYWKTTEEVVKAQNPDTASLWVSQYMITKHLGELNQWAEVTSTSDRTDLAPTASEPSRDENRNFRIAMEALGERFRKRDFECQVIRPRWWNEGAILQKYPRDPSLNETERRQRQNELEEARRKYEPGGEYETIVGLFDTLPGEDFDPDNPEPEMLDREDVEGRYHYFEAIRFQNDCGICHAVLDGRDPIDEPYLPGELMGVAHVTIPKPPAQDAIKRSWAQLLGVGIVTAFLSLIAFYAVIRGMIIKPLRNLRDVAESISRGDISKRTEFHTGDEFESVGEAFNRMLRHLVTTQEKLRKAYNDQEIKVDELAHLTLQLMDTNRLKSDFMATMSHELRTPLNSILGFSDVLGSIATLTEKQKRYVENINKSGRSLLTMINDILDMAKIESGRMEVSLSTFPIERTVAAQCDMAKPLLDKKNIDLQMRIEEELEPMHQDESRIQQVLNNLLSNAVKFTPEGGRIRVEVRRIVAAPKTPPPLLFRPAQVVPAKEIPMLELKVVDTGVGISEEDQQIVFEKFRQGKSAVGEGDMMKREHSGSGLGLSIVKEICKMLEGEISLESQLGVGSTFTVRLPWTLEHRARSESEMMAEIQEFSRNRVARAAARREGNAVPNASFSGTEDLP